MELSWQRTSGNITYDQLTLYKLISTLWNIMKLCRHIIIVRLEHSSRSPKRLEMWLHYFLSNMWEPLLLYVGVDLALYVLKCHITWFHFLIGAIENFSQFILLFWVIVQTSWHLVTTGLGIGWISFAAQCHSCCRNKGKGTKHCDPLMRLTCIMFLLL